MFIGVTLYFASIQLLFIPDPANVVIVHDLNRTGSLIISLTITGGRNHSMLNSTMTRIS